MAETVPGLEPGSLIVSGFFDATAETAMLANLIGKDFQVRNLEGMEDWAGVVEGVAASELGFVVSVRRADTNDLVTVEVEVGQRG